MRGRHRFQCIAPYWTSYFKLVMAKKKHVYNKSLYLSRPKALLQVAACNAFSRKEISHRTSSTSALIKDVFCAHGTAALQDVYFLAKDIPFPAFQISNKLNKNACHAT